MRAWLVHCLLLTPHSLLAKTAPVAGDLFLPDICEYLWKTSKTDEYRLDHYSRCLSRLADTQNALKSVDGITHQLKNTFSDSSTLQARYKAFKRSGKKNAKEAVKLLEYVNALERAFQAADVLQCVSEKSDDKRTLLLDSCGLLEIHRLHISSGKVKCVVCVLQPTDVAVGADKYRENELVVAICDEASVSVGEVLRLLSKKARALELRSVGLVQEDVSVQPALFDMAAETLHKLRHILSPAPPAVDVNVSVNATASPLRVRMLGYAVGGGVASLATMILDGTLACKSAEVSPFVGLLKDRVKAVCLGAPPSVSRSVISRNVLSLVAGDDCVCRATKDTLQHLRERVEASLKRGAGKSGFTGLRYRLGPGLLGDLSAVAGASVRQYTTGKHDLAALSVAGRVFFVKARRLKEVRAQPCVPYYLSPLP